jgi:hypothetical protein
MLTIALRQLEVVNKVAGFLEGKLATLTSTSGGFDDVMASNGQSDESLRWRGRT